MRLILIRHGQTTANERGLLDTAPPGAELTQLGRAQAAALPDLLGDQRVDAIYASSARRAQDTATPLAVARELAVQVRDDLREIAAGDLEMQGGPEAIRRYLGTIGEWMAGELDRPMAGGEVGRDALDRFDAVVRAETATAADAFGRDAGVVLVAHGAMLRFWASARGVNVPSTFGARRPLHNTGVIVLDGDPAEWRVTSWMGSAIEELDEGPDGPAGVPVMVRADSRAP